MLYTCEVCGRQFDYDQDVGYSKHPPICSAFCDGVRNGAPPKDDRTMPLPYRIDQLGEQIAAMIKEIRASGFVATGLEEQAKALVAGLLGAAEGKGKERE